tara:strand:+ start:101 stop:811 length:711 start_codon:yes stop_codon:yes gene_type:complete
MPYKLVFLFLLVSCTNYSSNFEKKSGYSASGFAYIEKNIPSQLENEKFFISQNKLRTGTKINIINPLNKKSLELQIKKKIEYDNFYKVLISKSIVKELELSSEFPFVEITEIIPMKSFIAKKAITQDEEKKIANRAPIDLININNISKKKKLEIKKEKSYSIRVTDFYSLNSAEFLKERLLTILKDSNYKLIYIKKINEKKYELLMGPYNTINKLRNDYIVLTDSNFEDLDIIIND